MNTLMLSSGASRRAFAHLLGLVIILTLCAAIAGCRSGNRSQPQNAPPRDAAEALSGQWTATLNPDLVEQGVAPITVPLVLQSAALAEGSAQVTGTMAGSEISEGSLSTAEAEPRVSFTTGAITPAEEMTVEGPLTWTATLQNGRLYGEVTSPDGRTGRWMATRN